MILLLYLIFFLSGFCGLLYEVILMKELTYVFGITAYAASTAITAFMGGLALGSWVCGKQNSFMKKPLVFYGWLEFLTGIAGLSSLFLLRVLEGNYSYLCQHVAGDASLGWMTFLRFLFSFPLAGLPAFFMGGTLPVFSSAVARRAVSGGPRVAFAYSVNTLGGAVGVILGSYFFIYRLGLWRAAEFCATLNTILFLLSLRLQKNLGEAIEKEAPQPEQVPGFSFPLASLVAFSSGLLAFIYEIIWFHLLGTIIGNTVYAFSIMLFSFLIAIVAGGFLASWILGRARIWAFALPASQFFAGILVLLTLPFWDRLSWVFVWIGRHNPGFFVMEATRFCVAFLLLFVPAFFVTQTFPLLFRFKDERISAHVSRLYSFNTLGSIFGGIIASFLLLQFLGSQLSLMLAALMNLLLGVFLAATLFQWQRAAKGALLLVVLAVFSLVFKYVPFWNYGALASGNYVYFREPNDVGQVIYFHEDALGGFTTVSQSGIGVRTLMTNGKFQGSNAGETSAQRNFVRVPAFFVRKFGSAFVIGLGTGQSLATALEYPFGSVDLAEISPGIVNAARTYFGSLNHNALLDKRVKLHMEDGRNFLLCCSGAYDLITMETSSIWIAGTSNLYNQEFYRLCSRHLTPDGVFQQWVQIHHITLADIARSVQTVRSIFPHVVFFVSGGQGIVVASRSPLVLYPGNIFLEKFANKAMERVSPLGDLFLNEIPLERFLREALPPSARPFISTDDDPVLEYSTPYGNSLGDDVYLDNLRRIGYFSLESRPPEMAGNVSQVERNLLLAAFFRSRSPGLAKKYFRQFQLETNPGPAK